MNSSALALALGVVCSCAKLYIVFDGPMFKRLIPNLPSVPRSTVLAGGILLAGTTLVFGLAKIGDHTKREKEFVQRFGTPTEDERQAAYREILKSGRSRLKDMGDFESNSWVDKHRRRLLATAKGNVLDVGVGAGRCLDDLLKNKRITEIVAVDQLEESLDLARTRLKSEAETGAIEIPVSLVLSDFHHLPFADNSFDTVVGCFTLCSAEDPIKVLQEMQRVSREKILLIDHGLSRFQPLRWLGHFLDVFPNVQAPWDIGCYEDRDISGLIRQAGLKVVDRKTALLGHVHIYVAKKTISDPSGSNQQCSETRESKAEPFFKHIPRNRADEGVVTEQAPK